ncbi:RNA-directed DNA polymerase from mobile element jockey [Eumeta japonica]|uniref:RNA-directed DNA polymerase from mobile element jockey n=1 Tax=Eumeta variegata TaxID=151549 RepID=A0A4C1UZS1_EUMVA|nr:RNA-directed DNA polymerase from mobile element jockey [Eumeta japonica]
MDTHHLLILITLGTTAHLNPVHPQTHRTNWSMYQRALEELHIGKSFSSPEEVDLAAQHFNHEIQTAYGPATTHLLASTCRRWDLPPRLQRALQHKRNLQSLWARTSCPRAKRDLNRVALELRQEVWTFRGAAWEEAIGQADEDWKDAPLRHKGSGGDPGRHPASDSHSIAIHHAEVEHCVREFLSTPIPLLPENYVSPTETVRTILRLPKRKALGPDGIPTIAIKQLPQRAMVARTRLFNGILRTGHFSGSWKTGRVIAIPKAGKDSRLASSQRPITLLSHISKPFKRILLRRLHRHLTPRQEQFEFRSGYSTTLPLAQVLHHIATEHNRGHRTVGIFLDMEKAFDRVWHSGLLFKLIYNQLPPALVRTVASFLKDRNFYVNVEDTTSDSHPISAGVSQGSCLSPCLYAVYTNDIPTLADQLQDWEEDVMLTLYADASAYLATSRWADLAAAKFQRVLDLLPD